jgi:hypothetical protein
MPEALKSYESLPSPALELVFEKVLNKDCRRSVGSFLVCCKTFYRQFLATEHQLTKVLRAHKETSFGWSYEMDEIISKLLGYQGGLSLSLTYNRLYVCLKAGSHFPSLAIFKNTKSQPAANMQLELLKKNVKLDKWAQQLKDVYAVTFSPITSTSSPLAVFAAVSAEGDVFSEVSDLLQKDLEPGGTLGSAEECPIIPSGKSYCIDDDRSLSICKFKTSLNDLYEVRSRSGPSSAYYALPECFADLVPADATILGTSRAKCWFQAVGEVKMRLRLPVK